MYDLFWKITEDKFSLLPLRSVIEETAIVMSNVMQKGGTKRRNVLKAKRAKEKEVSAQWT